MFPKELTTNLENEILGIRTSLGRIEGQMDEIGKLSERVSIPEQSQAWLKGAWTVLCRRVCLHLESHLCKVMKAIQKEDMIRRETITLLGNLNTGMERVVFIFLWQNAQL